MTQPWAALGHVGQRLKRGGRDGRRPASEGPRRRCCFDQWEAGDHQGNTREGKPVPASAVEPSGRSPARPSRPRSIRGWAWPGDGDESASGPGGSRPRRPTRGRAGSGGAPATLFARGKDAREPAGARRQMTGLSRPSLTVPRPSVAAGGGCCGDTVGGAGSSRCLVTRGPWSLRVEGAVKIRSDGLSVKLGTPAPGPALLQRHAWMDLERGAETRLLFIPVPACWRYLVAISRHASLMSPSGQGQLFVRRRSRPGRMRASPGAKKQPWQAGGRQTRAYPARQS